VHQQDISSGVDGLNTDWVCSTLYVQAHELDALVHNFPPSSLPAVITLRDTLLAYADTYPVRGQCTWVV
jgi:hypothetical protein